MSAGNTSERAAGNFPFEHNTNGTFRRAAIPFPKPVLQSSDVYGLLKEELCSAEAGTSS